MEHVIIVIHLMLVLALIGAVLLQRSEGGGLGIGGSGGGGFMSSRGTANILTRDRGARRTVFCDQSRVVDPGRIQPQADIHHSGRPERADGAGCAGAAGRRRRRRAAQAIAGRARGAYGTPFGAAGTAVKMRDTKEGPGNRPFCVVGKKCSVSRETYESPTLHTKSVKETMQAIVNKNSYRSAHRRRAALIFSRSSNRFGGFTG